MTWNEVEALIQTIPADRREEPAVWFDRDTEAGYIIDSMELIPLKDGVFDCTVGNDDTQDTYMISQ